MMGWLTEKHGGNQFKKTSIRTHLARLASQGYLTRLYRAGQTERKYVLAEAVVSVKQMDTGSLAEYTHNLLSEAGRPLTVTELVVAMRERGYRADQTPDTLRRAIRDMFKRYPGRFARGKDGAWEAVEGGGVKCTAQAGHYDNT